MAAKNCAVFASFYLSPSLVSPFSFLSFSFLLVNARYVLPP